MIYVAIYVYTGFFMHMFEITEGYKVQVEF